MKEEKEFNFETLAVHGGYRKAEPYGRSRAVPIYQTTSYTFENDKHAARLFSLDEPGNIYTRIMNPTTSILEKRISMLEHGKGALALSSGMSAETVALTTLLQNGDEILSSLELYGGTYTLMRYTLKKFGISTRFVDPHVPQNFIENLTKNTKVIYLETLGNPKLK